MSLLKIISKKEKLTGFRFFWLKTVNGFDDSVHCAKSLLGVYNNEVNNHLPTNKSVSLDYPQGQVMYLCGVSNPYVWENNFHLPFIIKTGSVAEKELYNGDKVIIEGAEALEFDTSVVDAKYSHLPEEFTTCRNFQFGAYYFKKD